MTPHRKTSAAALLLGVIGPASAANADVTALPAPELCVLYSMTLITGAATYEASQAELGAEIQRRGEACAPSETYMTAAAERVRRLDALSAHAEQMEQQSAADAELRRQERAARLRQALQNISNTYERQAQQYQQQLQYQQNKRSTTTCRPDGIGGMTCTTN